MQRIERNPYRGRGLPEAAMPNVPPLSTDAAAVNVLLSRCPAAAATPLTAAPGLAERAAVAAIHVKDERTRMGLGSFKALGAAYVIAHEAVATGADDITTALAGRTYVTASAGNHGMSVAAGARIFGADAVIYLAETVPGAFAARLRAKGAKVIVEGADYAASMTAAQAAAEAHGWTLLSDSSWPGYTDLPHRLMEGYLAMAAEITDAMTHAPTHVFLQAGVGGMAGAVAAHLRQVWEDAPVIVVVEPQAAPALIDSITAGRPVETEGPDSCMGRLDCKAPSLLALAGLARDADHFVTLSDGEAEDALPFLADAGLTTTPSGGAGLAALLSLDGDGGDRLGLTAASRVLAILSEGPEDAA